MERSWVKRFYEDHVVLWSLILLVVGFGLSTLQNVISESFKTPVSPPVFNVPEQKPPVVNVVIPEQKIK